MAARLGGVQDVAEPDRLCASQRTGNRPAPRQFGTGRPPRPRLVAQHHRPLRRRGHSRGASPVSAALSGRSLHGPLRRLPWAGQAADRHLYHLRTSGREHAADHARRRSAHGPPVRRRTRGRPAGARSEPRYSGATASAGSGRRGAAAGAGAHLDLSGADRLPRREHLQLRHGAPTHDKRRRAGRARQYQSKRRQLRQRHLSRRSLGATRASPSRGWSVEQNGYVLRMSSASGGPPTLPPPPQPQPRPEPAQPKPQPTQPPQTPQTQPPRDEE